MLTLTQLRRIITVALASKDAGDQVADAITPLPNIAHFGTQTAVRSDTVANCAADTEARLEALEGKFNTLLAAMKTGSRMTPD